jgi:Fur family transcriptional regulator, peroxide stress response regulator
MSPTNSFPVAPEQRLREALEASGHRFTEQRLAVFQFLADTESHPTAEEVFMAVRGAAPGISLATVYKGLETLVGCGLAIKLTYSDGSSRYDGRTDPHHHARCLCCARIFDVPGHLPPQELPSTPGETDGFQITGYRLEFTGYCEACAPRPG